MQVHRPICGLIPPMTALLKFSTVALIGKYRSRDAALTVLELARLLAGQSVRVLIDADTARLTDPAGFETADLAALGAQADLA
ncbi:MAG: hypothetical protein RIR70_2151, partial [Pseudomonadota bacterium]